MLRLFRILRQENYILLIFSFPETQRSDRLGKSATIHEGVARILPLP